MKVDSIVVLGAAAALLFLGLVGFMITDTETEKELIPGGDENNPQDYVEVKSEIRPFMEVGTSSIVFGLIIFLIFLLVATVSRLRR
ncbi:MAG: hypothetical protein V3U51_05500 [Thermoplasmata archaeon]